jgi:ubiquinone/menaquinone biosynthesis C-methylase UbiE
MDSVPFDSIAPVYDETRTFNEGCFNSALDFIVEKFPPAEYPKLFEPGIGTGRIAIPFAERGYKVTGVDISDEMLGTLKEKLRRRQSPLPVAFQKADITALPFPDASFNMAVAVHIYHLIRDWTQALNETFRVLKSGAPVILIFTGTGLEIPFVKDRYRELCAECGQPARQVGISTENPEFEDYLAVKGRHVEWFRDRWQWTQPVRVDKAINDIRSRFYSSSKLVSDTVHRAALEKLESEMKTRYGELSVELEVPCQITVAFVLTGAEL